jgi:hypothetical protein
LILAQDPECSPSFISQGSTAGMRQQVRLGSTPMITLAMTLGCA